MLDKLKEINLFWLVDPKTKKVSVSLTMLVISFAALLIGCGLEMAEVTKSTSVLVEIFYANVALYFGRRFSFKGQAFSSEPPTTEKAE